MVERQPTDDGGLLGMLKRRLDHSLVVQHIGVAHHHAFGRRGRAGGILQERHHLACDEWIAPFRGRLFHKHVGGTPLQRLQLRGMLQHRGGLGQKFCIGKGNERLSICNNGSKTG